MIEAEDQKNKLRIDVNDLEMKNENLLNELEHMKSEIIMAEKEINQVKQRLDEETLKLNKKEEELQNERLEIVSLCKMYEERLKQSEKDQNNIEKENKKMIEDLKIKIETTTELEANPYELDEQIKSEDMIKLISDLEIEKEKKDSEIEKLIRSSEDLHNRLQTKDEQSKVLTEEIKRHNSKIENLVTENKKLKANIDKMQVANQDKENKQLSVIKSLKAEVEKYKSDKETMAKDFATYKEKTEMGLLEQHQNFEKLNSKMKVNDDELSKLKSEIIKLHKQIGLLNDELAKEKHTEEKLKLENKKLQEIYEKELEKNKKPPPEQNRFKKAVVKISFYETELQKAKQKAEKLQKEVTLISKEKEVEAQEAKQKYDHLTITLKKQEERDRKNIEKLNQTVKTRSKEISALELKMKEMDEFYKQDKKNTEDSFSSLQDTANKKIELLSEKLNTEKEKLSCCLKELDAVSIERAALLEINKKLQDRVDVGSGEIIKLEGKQKELMNEIKTATEHQKSLVELNKQKLEEIEDQEKEITRITENTKELKDMIKQLEKENTDLHNINETFVAEVNRLKGEIDKIKVAFKEELDHTVRELSMKYDFELRDALDGKKDEFHKVLDDKIQEISELKETIANIEKGLAQKDADLKDLKEMMVELQKQKEEEISTMQNESIRNKELVEREKKATFDQMVEEFEEKYTNLEVEYERLRYEAVNEIQKSRQQDIDKLIVQRDELLQMLSKYQGKTDITEFYKQEVAKLSKELDMKTTEVEQLQIDWNTDQRIIKFMMNCLDQERNKQIGSNEEILSILNNLCLQFQYYVGPSRNNSVSGSLESIFNQSSGSSCNTTPSLNDLNTTWPSRVFAMKLPLRRSFESLLTNQGLIKERIEKLKNEISLRIKDIIDYRASQSVALRERSSLKSISNSDSGFSELIITDTYIQSQFEAIDESFIELERLLKKVSAEELTSETWLEHLNLWEKRAKYRLQILKNTDTNNNAATTCYPAYTKSVVYRPTNAEIKAIIANVNEKYASTCR